MAVVVVLGLHELVHSVVPLGQFFPRLRLFAHYATQLDLSLRIRVSSSACIELYGAAVGTLSVQMIVPGSSTACVALGAPTPSTASFSCRQEDKLSNDGLFVFLQRTEAEFARLGASPFSLGASPCKACWPLFMVDFDTFSSLFRVLFVLSVGLARLGVFPFSSRRLEYSCYRSQSTKGDFSICWAPGLRLSSAFSSVLRFYSLLGLFVDCCVVFSVRRVFSFFSGGLEFFFHPSQSKM